MVGSALLSPAANAIADSSNDAAPLVLERATLQRHSLGTDHYDVWLCDVPKKTTADEWKELPGRVATSAQQVTEKIQAFAPAYFNWLSNGKYQLELRARGALKLGLKEGFKECKAMAVARSAGRDGVIVVSNVRGDTHAFGAPDACQDDSSVKSPCDTKPSTLPGSRRGVELGALTLFPKGSEQPHNSTVVHELGHALGWPHSFTGRYFVEVAPKAFAGVEYDDPVDVMGYEFQWGSTTVLNLAAGKYPLKGTQVFNRYSSGWLDPGQAVIDIGESAQTYEINAVGSSGVQMVALPGSDPAEFMTIESRLKRGFDESLPYDGVDIHVVAQQAAICSSEHFKPAGCWGEDRRTTPAPTDPNSLVSFLKVGESRNFGAVQVKVLERTENGFKVSVSQGKASLPVVYQNQCLITPKFCGPNGRPVK